MAKQFDANARWMSLTDAARERWDRLTEDDLQRVRGNTERLISLLQARYGYARGAALRELGAWRQAISSRATLH